MEVVVLTRDTKAFLTKAPHLTGAKGLSLVLGDVRSFNLPKERFTHVIHAATTANGQMNLERPLEMIDTIVNGAARVFDFAGACGAKTVLHTSSGGVYGSQPDGVPFMSEEYNGAPNPLDPLAAYSEAKRLAEMMGSISSRKYGFDHKVARITALVGPHLPLDIHYALGNFIGDALRGEPIRIKGDGSPVRSYLYIADLIAWLWVVMVRGLTNRPYNAGSEVPISLLEAARAVARIQGGSLGIEVAGKPMRDGRPSRYVPSTERARTELGLLQWTDFDGAIRKTLDWHRAKAGR
jgi:dTDP-glucose 4,6-dehydratase